MDLGIETRVAIVTAATRGLGKAAAEALAAEGVRLVINGRDVERLKGLCERLDAEAIPVAGDLSDPELARRLVDIAHNEFGQVDIVVANNGGPPPGDALSVSEAAMWRALDANLVAMTRLVRTALPSMREAGWGRICVIASGSAKQPMDGLALSNLARPGLWGWLKTASQELAGEGVTLNLVCPGLHATERAKELGRANRDYIGNPDDFGRIVAFMCSAHTSFMTGTAVVLDGGKVQGL
jgi:3-oxoacyl-[acyl-carrier protein] reductase